MIKWKDEYKIGIAEIDEQHKKIFDIANEAYELLKDEFSYDKYDRIIELLEELKNYAKFHFSYEEDYMLSIKYKGYFSQKVAHDNFVEKINSYDLNDIDENQDQYILEILDFVVDWISKHILVSDKQIPAQ
ncbi:hemerythrin family protein [Tepidanaerobacter sp. GT38]|uniref:bacteriohemerythrin n=1 Tax=Tepidanaerobacter sp. GT38 TaxID=2722793 RepID=UPI001F32F507|nr:hemerythrin family protein [Tepidanaerobacter sp. GT38]MCG1011647.1 hemerythrin family protein [Tepidanaerobacter sp. GT38]